MEKNNESANRSFRNRNQLSDSQRTRGQESNGGNRPFAGLSPNYESGYRPGEYGIYSRSEDYRNEQERSRGRYNNEGRGRYSNEGYFNDPQGVQSREWDDVSNDESYNSRQRNASTFNEDENQYGFNNYNELGNRDWNRLESPSYERGNSDPANLGRQYGNRADSQYFGQSNNSQDGQHRGKGPKGYTRSDERIKEDIHERLTHDGHIDASEIEVEVRSGEVILRGSVTNRQEKRRAEDIIDRISGVKDIENLIRVNGSGNQSRNDQYTNGQRERKGILEYGPGAVSGMGNTSATGDLNTAN